jgi:hypothetical protein
MKYISQVEGIAAKKANERMKKANERGLLGEQIRTIVELKFPKY